MHSRLRAEIEALAKLTPDVEICGLGVIKHDDSVAIYPCANVAHDPTAEFEIAGEDLTRVHQLGYRPLWVYHTHPRTGAFSEADLAYAEEMGTPQWLYDVTASKWMEYIPKTYQAPALEGRRFIWGEVDCYTLLRDFARQRWNRFMTDYPRSQETSGPALGMLAMQQVEAEGFQRLPGLGQVQVDDIMVFKTNGSPQHFAIFKGNSRVLHHPYAALSRVDQFSMAWQRRLHCICRYQGKPNGVRA